MSFRHILSTLVFLPLFVGCAHNHPQFQGSTPDEKISSFFKWSYEREMRMSPMTMSYYGLEGADEAKLDDISDATMEKRHQMTKQDLAILESFDRDVLSEQNKLSYDLFKFNAERSLEGYRWRYYGYSVNQMFGVHAEIPGFMINTHKVKNEQDLKNYISRLQGFKTFLGQLETQLMRSEASGVVPPQFVFPLVIRDSKNIISGQPFDQSKKDSPLFKDFKEKLAKLKLSKSQNSQYIKQATFALKDSVKPGYSGLIAFLESQKKRATNDDGAWKFPKGDEYYRYRLKFNTTTNMTADQIHSVGLTQVARIHQEMRAIGKKMGVGSDLKKIFKHMRSKKYIYPNNKKGKARYLKKATRLIATMKKSLPRFFNTLPKADIVVKAVEPFREKSAGMAFYQHASLNGKRPGTYYVNLYNMEALPVWEAEALAYHEGVPGHHMQLTIANELTHLPLFRRTAHVTAYVEGWGLYSEKFPKEYGFYKDPASDFGRLSMELTRACRLVVDTGIHSKKWTHDQAIKYLDENLPGDHDDNVRQIRRYIVMPGQATAYMVGQLKILELRDKARKALGSAFDIRQFHDVILTNGAMPLNILEKQIDRYIAKTKASQRSNKKG